MNPKRIVSETSIHSTARVAADVSTKPHKLLEYTEIRNGFPGSLMNLLDWKWDHEMNKCVFKDSLSELNTRFSEEDVKKLKSNNKTTNHWRTN